MEENKGQRCENCTHYVKGQQLEQGECHLNPPTVHMNRTQLGIGKVSVFPDVKANQCCGQFTPKILSEIN